MPCLALGGGTACGGRCPPRCTAALLPPLTPVQPARNCQSILPCLRPSPIFPLVHPPPARSPAQVDPGVRRSVLDLEGGNLEAAMNVLRVQLQELDLHVARPNPKPGASVQSAPAPDASVQRAPAPGASIQAAVEELVTGPPPAGAPSLVPALVPAATASLPAPNKLLGGCAANQGTQLTEGPPPLGAAPIPVPIRLGVCAASHGTQPTEDPPPLGAVVPPPLTLPLPLPSNPTASPGAQPVQGARPPGGSSHSPMQSLAIPAPPPATAPSKLYGCADETTPPAFPLEPSSYLDSAASTPSSGQRIRLPRRGRLAPQPAHLQGRPPGVRCAVCRTMPPAHWFGRGARACAMRSVW